MKTISSALAAAALAAAGLGTAVDVVAQDKHGFRGHHGRHWHGHGHRHHRHHGHWSFGLSFGMPLAWGWGWGPGWYGDPYFYGPPPVIYREREVIREPIEPAPEPQTTEVPRGEGAPTQGPLYMNYCESAKAYFPRVTSCPEGWKFIAPTQ